MTLHQFGGHSFINGSSRLFFFLQASAVCLRAPVSESLSRLQRDQLQKFAQYLISELPQQVSGNRHLTGNLLNSVTFILGEFI